MATTPDSPPRPEKRRRTDRVTVACDLCKKRKTKCDGEQPCAYCTRKNRADTCAFSTANAQSQVRSAGNTPHTFIRPRGPTPPPRRRSHDGVTEREASLSPTVSRNDHQDDTVVPLEGRILRDAQGKVIFIGDCAPLSFLQTVRHLIASEVDSEGISTQAVRDSIIEVAPTTSGNGQGSLAVTPQEIPALVDGYTVATSGLVDLFQKDELIRELRVWAAGVSSPSDDCGAAMFFLVLAIGAQEHGESRAQAWFEQSRDQLVKHMCNNMNAPTVQGFILVALYMLRAFQPNGAYLYFSLAARAAYAIGIHRTEVNASFGQPIKIRRDRIWKSLRVVDQLISNVLGRPPTTSDVDCTVKYSEKGSGSDTSVDILDASVQIFMIIERVVVEVYSRKRISLRIADYVSRQLKGWASKYLSNLSQTILQSTNNGVTREAAVGACSTLCSYYYGIMLLTRPFLIYDLYEHMGVSLKSGGTQADHQEKQKYAYAALDAASSLVDSVQTLIETGQMPRRMPLVVSWLFTATLVLAVGGLGESGLTLKDNCADAIRCLDYFCEVDPHARQYSLIAHSLTKVITSYVKNKELQLRLQRKQASSELFGLLPSIPTARSSQPSDQPPSRPPPEALVPLRSGQAHLASSDPFDWTIYDADFFALPWLNENDQGLQDFLQPGTHTLDGASVADIPLFPIYDQSAGG
ncbi:hypothetical protein LEMA_P008550.1 [Plenodomus lingam JN3]|uniref:Zn(2)-C6 fungal-type domain-containing protein n=2 Tax=Leptosphaeria maculans TaxID=5022 RepID=E5AFS9_LEPMJ|nr:hypothetical protein LEMA_P008550.1 [Plenodomus lingam JN3]CBY02068.1 hypothetical protein LEMA_P008550.1 [Plenodomus lingam JN3]